jgi:hypothetical protein
MKKIVLAMGLSIVCVAVCAETAAAGGADPALDAGQQAGAPPSAVAVPDESAEARRLTAQFARLGLWQAFIDNSDFGEISGRLATNSTAQGAETARVAPLEGLVQALSAQVNSGTLPPPVVAALNAQIAATLATIAQVPDYKSDDSRITLIVPETHFLTDINQRPLWLQFVYQGSWDKEHEYLNQESSNDQRMQLGFLYSPVDRVLLGLSGFYESTAVDLTALTGHASYDAVGIKGDLGVVLSSNLGLYLSYEYARQNGFMGVTTAMQSGPFYLVTPNREGRNYAQAQLLGSFTNRDLPFIAQKLTVKPYVGIDFYDSNFATTTDNLGQAMRTVFGTSSERMGLARVGSKFTYDVGKFVPRLQATAQVGFEDEFANNTDTVVKGGSNAIAGLGFEYVLAPFSRISGLYRYREGITADRNSSEWRLVAVFSF